MQIISRSEAIATGSSRYFTGTPCKSGHVCERRVSDWKCVACHRERVKASLKTPEGRARMAKYDAKRNADPERIAALRRDEKKPDRKARKAAKSVAYVKEYRSRPGVKEQMAKAKAEWTKSGTDAAINYRLSVRLRIRLLDAVRGQYRSGVAVRLLGCSIPELRAHLERQFSPGMSWANYGKWHIDHIQPLASFDLSDDANLRAACHFTNLQPLWARDNLSKGSKSPDEWQRSAAA